MTAQQAQAGAVPGVPHSVLEDVFGLLTGTFVASLGIYLLKSAHAVTGGTAGLSLLLTYASGWPFGVLYFLTNLPFFALAIRTKGGTSPCGRWSRSCWCRASPTCTR